MEPLNYKVNSNPHINEACISISNIKKQVKVIAHADDTTAILTTTLSYHYLKDRYIKFGNVSGSRVFTDKTEIFTKGQIEGLPNAYQKERITVFGYNIGIDVMKDSLP